MSEWRPIETAPRPFVRILVATKQETLPPDWPEDVPWNGGASVHEAYWDPSGNSWVGDELQVTGVWYSGSGWLEPGEVTHWMPLPPPPC